ncbi:SDR family NAD(P)-dependent oxidoreductase [Paenibacillus arenosi]|uniref:SDR family NAD(P)-dependent oxidoreductase n=1 Tax=Paenibacillus arenosi TaxID=2774142 RepID=A0ABR9AT98_9BACL|nr:type I polyketide synthase [Paenibacillus arenosi]MBD8496928.1 SDR family NAD(P)-dependent oxidoreductase [Paenibacillus arenosi]
MKEWKDNNKESGFAMMNDEQRTGLEIAVIGMAGRFPGASNINHFWNNLVQGVESIVFLTDEELERAGVSKDTYNRKDYVKSCGAVLENRDVFDAAFFGYTPAEAEMMDPQTRIFHECAWEALEHAGYDPGRYGQRIGLYAAAGSSFDWEVTTRLSGKRERLGDYASWLLDSNGFLPTRVSYKLNLTGPSVLLHTTCSSSLIAIDMACRSLLTGQCEIALAGGVSVGTAPREGYLYQDGMILSADGHCRAFDAEASGTVGGEGAGIVVLKPLEDAIRDSDHIMAVIKGFAANNDGSRKIGYTAPSTVGQSEVIMAAMDMAAVEAESITYVETHGTGTALGDPVELKALSTAFATDKKQFCRIGSVKTNIGHLDEAAGMAGFMKTVLALQHRVLPPSLHYKKANPNIDFENTPFQVNAGATEWKDDGYPLRAGVSSFGIGGTNAHLVLEEPPQEMRRQETKVINYAGKQQQLLLLSAKTETALAQVSANLAQHFKDNPDLNLADAAYTLQVGRSVMEHKQALVVSSADEAIAMLSDKKADTSIRYASKDVDVPIVFMFPGQGSQYVDMGKVLYETEPVFREKLDYCVHILEKETGRDYREVLYPSIITEQTKQAINETEFAQPLLFSIEYALASVLIKWGIKPSAMIGHSLGEYVAACLAGVLSLEEALKLVALRGRLMQSMPPGGMLSVQMPQQDLYKLLRAEQGLSDLSIAVINTPMNCVVSGPDAQISLLEDRLLEEGCLSFRVHTSHAFHSDMMTPMLPEFRSAIERLNVQAPSIPYVSNVSGNWMEADQVLDREYWPNHLLSAVRFSDGIQKLLEYESCLLIEVGPGRTLSSFVAKHDVPKDKYKVLNLIKHPNETVSDDVHFTAQLGKLWSWGVNINWKSYHLPASRSRTPLPAYPFEGQRYWLDIDMDQITMKEQLVPIDKKEQLADWFYAPIWKQSRNHVSRVTSSRSRVLLLADSGEFGSRLKHAWAENGKEVILVHSGDSYRKELDGTYTVCSEQSSDYDQLFSDLEACKIIPDVIAFAWEIERIGHIAVEEVEAEMIARESSSAMACLIRIAQSLGRRSIHTPMEIVVLSNSIHQITGEEQLQPEQAVVLGPIRVIPLEYANLTCRSVDIALPLSQAWNRKFFETITAEITSRMPEQVVAYRGGNRWVQDYEQVLLPSSEGTPALLKQQGVYVITGGLGGMGLAIARYLISELQAKVIMFARHLDPAKLEQANSLAAGGGELLVLQADVTNKDQLYRAVVEAEVQFGVINGVFHTAGVPDGGIMQFRSEKDTEQVLAPKTEGALHLYQIFKDRGLDFLFLCSSISSMLAPAGQVAYCAANNFLDHFALATSSTGHMHVVAVNWDTWRDTGMALDAEKRARSSHQISENFILEDGILAAEGIEVLKRILNVRLPQVVVSVSELSSKLTANQQKAQLAELLKTSNPLDESFANNDEQKTSNKGMEADREQTITMIWKEHLGVQHIGLEDNFFDLGASSLDLIQVRLKIMEKLKVELSIIDMYTYSTIAALSNYLGQPFKASEHSAEQETVEEVLVPTASGYERGQNRLQQRKRKLRGGD